MALILRRLARRDIAEAYRWYRALSGLAAQGFLDAVSTRLASIEAAPERFVIVHRAVRRALLGRFPDGL